MIPRWLAYTLLTMLLWGGWGLLSKPASGVMSSWEVQAFSAIGLIPVIIVLLSSRKVRASMDARAGFGLAFGSGVLGSLGNVAYRWPESRAHAASLPRRIGAWRGHIYPA